MPFLCGEGISFILGWTKSPREPAPSEREIPMLPAVRLKAENNKRKTSLIRLDERGFLVAASGFEPLTLRV